MNSPTLPFVLEIPVKGFNTEKMTEDVDEKVDNIKNRKSKIWRTQILILNG